MKCLNDKNDPFAVIRVNAATILFDQQVEIAYMNTAFTRMIKFGEELTDVAFARRIYELQDVSEPNNLQAKEDRNKTDVTGINTS